jgi:GntR family transcriptional repressor for pyruvate dehydrogenase complex
MSSNKFQLSDVRFAQAKGSAVNATDGEDARFRRMGSLSGGSAKGVAQRIRDAVRTGLLRPGDKLPSEHELAASFEVARGTVREALRTLAASGLVRSSRGSHGGTYITVPDTDWVIEQLSDLVALWFQVGDISLAEVFEAREVLEHACVIRAVANRTEDDLAMMRAPVERSRQPDISDDEFIAADLEFHTAVSTAAKNSILGLAMSSVHMSRPRTNRLILKGLDRTVIADQHWAMYEAIRDQDAERAIGALAAHINHLDHVRRTELPDLDPRTISITGNF